MISLVNCFRVSIHNSQMWDTLARHNSIAIPHWIWDFQIWSLVSPEPMFVPSRWFWLDKATIEAIDLGNFNINQLTKPQREESARNRYLTKTSNEFKISLDESKVELITTHMSCNQPFQTCNPSSALGKFTSLCALNIIQNTTPASPFGPKNSSIAHPFIPETQFSIMPSPIFKPIRKILQHIDSIPIPI